MTANIKGEAMPRSTLEPANILEAPGCDVQYRHMEASFGHDSFLVEVETMTDLVGGYLTERWNRRSNSASKI
jgi:homoserine acetyltransferase